MTEKMMTLDAEEVRNMLIYVCQYIIENKYILTEADRKIGDGDHGIGMEAGMLKAMAKLKAMDRTENVCKLFGDMGMTMMMTMGGASGIIFGSMFMGGAQGREPLSILSAQQFSELMEGGLKTVKERGKAAVGDKTMVDALEPAVHAMKENFSKGYEEMLFAAWKAAEKGVEDSAGYMARFGRAKSLMERSIGYPDAGCITVSLIFKSMYEFVKEREESK